MELSVKNLNKFFGDNHVLKGVDFTAQSGQALGLLGRNGAGKTTAIRIIMGVFAQDSGEVLLDHLPIERSKIRFGYLPEERGLYPKKIILDQLIYFGLLKGLTKKEALVSIDYWLTRLEMMETKKKRLDTLSKGNQQKIQLVATLMADLQIIILDEPFSGLDPVNAMMLKDIVKELIEQNRIVFFSSHQMSYIEEFCDDIAILNDGKIVLEGDIRQIKRSYDRRKIIISASKIDTIEKQLTYPSQRIENRLLVTLNREEEKGNLLAELAQMHADIDELKVFEPSLNDIFVEYTGGKI